MLIKKKKKRASDFWKRGRGVGNGRGNTMRRKEKKIFQMEV
jgi:hypothetical protein